MSQTKSNIFTRRAALLTGAAALAAPAIAYGQAQRFVIRDPGGAWGDAARAAFYQPFRAETGIEVVAVTSAADPISQVKSIVDTKSYIWDATNVTVSVHDVLGGQGYLEEIQWSGPEMANLIPKARGKWFMGVDVFAVVYGYRTDRMRGKTPAGWADFWDVKNFPGRRGLRKSPVDTFEQALLADGVAPAQLYPLDVDRALRKLDQIRNDVGVWWTGGAQATQALSTGEVDLCASWNSRIQTSIDDKVPAQIAWDQALYSVEGWAILKGTPRADLVQRFIRFCADPKRQAEFVKRVPFGPTNPGAYQFVEKARAESLPTAPGRIEKLVYQDPAYWGQNQERLLERFNAWLLK